MKRTSDFGIDEATWQKVTAASKGARKKLFTKRYGSFMKPSNRQSERTCRKQIAAWKATVGSWKNKDHPELKAGAVAWTRKLRRESEARFRKQFRNR